MIQFQAHNDKFGPAAEKIVEKIFEKCQKGYLAMEVQKFPEVKEFQNLIFSRFKIKTMMFTEGTMAAILPFYMSQSHIFLHKVIRGHRLLEEQEIHRYDGNMGWVDLESATVGGVFSEYTSSLYMNFNTLNALGCTPRMVVGILLHELGHYFGACQFNNRLDRGNQIFNESLKKSSSSKGEEKIKIFFREIQKGNKNITEDMLDGLTSKNPVVFGRTAMKLANEIYYSQLVDSTYDRTSFEMLADNFSTRMGYGKELVEAFELMGGPEEEKAESMLGAFITTMNTVRSYINQMTYLWLSSVFGVAGFGTLSISYLLMALTAMMTCVYFLYILVITAGETGKDYTYDDLPKRYNRIRQQLIEQIKQKAYNKADTKALVENIDAIGKLIASAGVYRGPIDFLFNTLNPRDRRAKSSIERQQAVEDLFTNELFVKSFEMNMMVNK